jgi:hypothetical protein
MTTYRGACFCGTVQIEVTGAPEGMGYCHCRSCRSWSGAPVTAFALFKPEALRIAAGGDRIASTSKSKMSERKYCTHCGGHLMTDHPPLGLVDVYPSTIPTLGFAPGLHVNYSGTVLPMQDGLPKFRDFPASFGGSGVMVPEESEPEPVFA